MRSFTLVPTNTAYTECMRYVLINNKHILYYGNESLVYLTITIRHFKYDYWRSTLSFSHFKKEGIGWFQENMEEIREFYIQLDFSNYYALNPSPEA